MRKVYATTSSLNIPASRLFQSLGFTKEASLPNQYKQGSEEYIWGMFLITPRNIIKPSNKLLLDPNQQFQIVRKFQSKDKGYLDNVVNLIAEWHAELNHDFILRIINATQRGLDYETKGKQVFVSEFDHKQTGMAITTPKRGGAVKVYPLFGSGSAQKSILETIKHFYNERGYKKLYTLTVPNDKIHLLLLEEFGFTQRGILRSPYKDGYDLAILDVEI